MDIIQATNQLGSASGLPGRDFKDCWKHEICRNWDLKGEAKKWVGGESLTIINEKYEDWIRWR